MGTLLKVGEQEIATYKNAVQYPVPYAAGQVSYSWYSGTPNPNTSISFLLNQLDGATTRGYNQYLEDYARYTTPLLGTGTEEDPYYFYPHSIMVRSRATITAADFETKPHLNIHHLIRAYVGVQVRLTTFWYNASNVSLWSSFTSPSVINDSGWFRMAGLMTPPPQSILDQVTYAYIGMEVMSGMNASQNWFDVTGFRATPVEQADFDDFRGNYWDGSTVFPQASYVSTWNSTPRSSQSTLNITAIAATTAETESVESLSVAEDVTGLDASAISGGSAQGNVTIEFDEDTPDYLGLAAEIRDDNLGNFYGKVRNLNQVSGQEAGITIDESLSLLNAWVTAPPMSGTLASVLRNYVALAEAPIRPFTFEDSTGTITVNAPGFVGNLYDKIRELLAAYSAELVTVNGVHIVRKPMLDSVVLENFSDTTNVSSSVQETSEFVRIHWYDNEYVTNGQVYPLAANPGEAEEDIPEPTIYSVGSEEVLNVDIQLRASLLSVNVPTYVAFVPDQDVTGGGVYTAVGSDSLPITPAQWAAKGGKLAVRISEEDPSIIKVTITGPDIPELAPFRIAMSSGSGNYYNALRITGTGVFIRDQYVDLATGALPSTTGQKNAVECTNPYISTRQQAYQVGQIVAGRVQQQQDINFGIPAPEDQVLFGLLPGKKFVHGNQQFRIETTDVNHHTVTGTGTYALTVADYDHFFTRGTPFTVGAFDALYAGKTVTALNFSLKPLLHRFVEV